MIITLIINGKPIESRFVPDGNLQLQGYLQGLQNDMIEQNEDILDLTESKAEFVISDFPSVRDTVRN
jgi:hypothetical protein